MAGGADPGQRVLCVEDDEGTAELIRRRLTREGYRVDVATSLQTGLDALDRTPAPGYKALLLDYHLPDGEPWQLGEAARRAVPEVPVVVVTASSDQAVAVEALRRGFADYVRKTEGFWDELPAVLERVAKLHRIKGRLNETSELMRAIVEHSSDLVVVVDGEGAMVYLSPGCHGLLGFDAAEMIGGSWTSLVAAEDRATLAGLLADSSQHPTGPVTVRCLHRQGATVWAEARASILAATDQTAILLTFHDVTEQRAHEEQIEASLREKEVLLREIHHRVKNNLQVIQSLLRMEARQIPQAETRQALETTVERVRAMGLVHERLYKMGSLSRLALADYLSTLFDGVVASSSKPAGQVALELDVEEIPISLELAVPFGLLANELISNCFKHAFPEGRRGTVRIFLHRVDKRVRLSVEDNGVGLPEGFDAQATPSMGLKLAESLARQLGGKLRFSSPGGCRIEAELTRL